MKLIDLHAEEEIISAFVVPFPHVMERCFRKYYAHNIL